MSLAPNHREPSARRATQDLLEALTVQLRRQLFGAQRLSRLHYWWMVWAVMKSYETHDFDHFFWPWKIETSWKIHFLRNHSCFGQNGEKKRCGWLMASSHAMIPNNSEILIGDRSKYSNCQTIWFCTNQLSIGYCKPLKWKHCTRVRKLDKCLCIHAISV